MFGQIQFSDFNLVWVFMQIAIEQNRNIHNTKKYKSPFPSFFWMGRKKSLDKFCVCYLEFM